MAHADAIELIKNGGLVVRLLLRRGNIAPPMGKDKFFFLKILMTYYVTRILIFFSQAKMARCYLRRQQAHQQRPLVYPSR